MAANVGAIRASRAFVELFADDTKLARTLKSAEQKIKAFGASIRKMGAALAGGGLAVATPLIASAKAFASVGDALDEMSQRTGVSVESLSQLKFGLDLAGSSLEGFEKSLRKAQVNITDAASGSKAAKQAFAALGLKISDLKSLSPEAQFLAIADAIARIEDPTRRAAAAVDIFGRSGTELIPFLAQGSAGIERLKKEADKLGLTMSTEDARAAAVFADAIDRLLKSLRALSIQVGAALAPSLSRIADQFTAVTAAVRSFAAENPGLITSLATVAAGMTGVGGAMVALGFAASAVGAGFGVVANAIKALLASLAALQAAVVASVGANAAIAAAMKLTKVGASGASLAFAALAPPLRIVNTLLKLVETGFIGVAAALVIRSGLDKVKAGFVGAAVAMRGVVATMAAVRAAAVGMAVAVVSLGSPLTLIRRGFEGLLVTLTALASPLGIVRAGFAGLSVVIGSLVAPLGLLRVAFAGVVIAIGALAAPMLIVAGAIGVFVALTADWSAAWDAVATAAAKSLAAIKSKVMAVKEVVQQAVDVLSKLKQQPATFSTAVSDDPTIENARDLKNQQDSISAQLKHLTNQRAGLQNLLNQVMSESWFSLTRNFRAGVITKELEKIDAKIRMLGNSSEAIRRAWIKLPADIQSASQAADIVGGIFNSLKSAAAQIGAGVKSVGGGIGKAVSGSVAAKTGTDAVLAGLLNLLPPLTRAEEANIAAWKAAAAAEEQTRRDNVALADSIRQSVMTTAEAFQAELAKLQELRAGGFIDDETFNRASDKLAEKFGELEKAATQVAERLPDFLKIGTQAAAEAILRHQFGGQDVSRIEQQQLTEQRNIRRGIDELTRQGRNALRVEIAEAL